MYQNSLESESMEAGHCVSKYLRQERIDLIHVQVSKWNMSERIGIVFTEEFTEQYTYDASCPIHLDEASSCKTNI